MYKPIRIFWLVSAAMVLCVPGGQAQDADSSRGPAPVAPGTRPLTGVQNLTLGDDSDARSSLLTNVSITTQLDKNPPASGYDKVASVSYLLGRLDLHHVSGRSQSLLDYVGGVAIMRSSTDSSSAVQDLGVSQSFQWRRWSALLADKVSYLSESPFGFGGVGGLGFLGNVSQSAPGAGFGTNGTSLRSALTPNQTIPTAGVSRLSNTVAAQAEYQVTHRSSWTAAGSYGLLKFSHASYSNSRDALFQTGYNYQINGKSTVAVFYRFDAFRFTHRAQQINDQAIQFSYERRVTGQLSFQIAAGPDLQVFRAPFFGPSSQVSWRLQNRLIYQVKNTYLEASYDHFLANGSGVLFGAQVDQVQQTVGRNLTRTWQGSISLGYALNRSLKQTTATLGPRHFSDWYSAVRFNHRLTPGAELFVGYGARLQGNNTAVCAAGLSCGTNFITHAISLGFSWGLRPITLQ